MHVIQERKSSGWRTSSDVETEHVFNKKVSVQEYFKIKGLKKKIKKTKYNGIMI